MQKIKQRHKVGIVSMENPYKPNTYRGGKDKMLKNQRRNNKALARKAMIGEY